MSEYEVSYTWCDEGEGYHPVFWIWLEKDGQDIWEWWMEDVEWYFDKSEQIKEISKELATLGLYVSNFDDSFENWIIKEL